MKIESDTTKTAPKYPTLVKVVTAAATAALLSACDEPAPQRTAGLPADEPAPQRTAGESAPVDDSRRADILPESRTSACDEPDPQRTAGLPAPLPYEPKIESVPEPADSPLDNPPATSPNID